MSVTSSIPQDAFLIALLELRCRCAPQVGQLQSSVEHELYSDKGPIADRHEHPARTSSMGHASDIKRSIYLHRQRQMTAMTLRAMGGRAIKRTHSVRTCMQPSDARSDGWLFFRKLCAEHGAQVQSLAWIQAGGGPAGSWASCAPRVHTHGLCP